VELEPSSASYYKLGEAEFDACNPRAAYAAALRAVAAARRERSFQRLFNASRLAYTCILHGALGPTWRWSQLAPFLDNMEEALPHLKRWVPPLLLEPMYEGWVSPRRELRLDSQPDRSELYS
jgi:hypothetical protein